MGLGYPVCLGMAENLLISGDKILQKNLLLLSSSFSN